MSGFVKNIFWAPVPNIQVLGPAEESPTRSTIRSLRNRGMPPSFQELTQGSYARNDVPFAEDCSSTDMSKDSEDVSLPDSHALLHVTNRRKTNTMVIDSATSRIFWSFICTKYLLLGFLSKKIICIFWCHISDCWMHGLTRRNQIRSHSGWQLVN